MKKLFFTIMMLTGFFMVGSCQNSFPGGEGQKWILQKIGQETPFKESVPNLTFSRGQVFGSAGCNAFNGSFTVLSKKITIKEINSTTMVCNPDEVIVQETRFMTLLESVTDYSIEANVLSMFSKGEQVLVFKKAPQIVNLPLDNTRWDLSSIIEGELVRTPMPTSLGIRFKANTIMVTGCKQKVSGRFILRGKIIRVKLDGKDHQCSRGSDKDIVLDSIENATKMWIKGDRMFLRTQTGDGLDFHAK